MSPAAAGASGRTICSHPKCAAILPAASVSSIEVPGKPSLGSWLSYGLGSESNDLPAFVVFTPKFPATGNGQALFTRMWSSGFLPTKHAGVALRGSFQAAKKVALALTELILTKYPKDSIDVVLFGDRRELPRVGCGDRRRGRRHPIAHGGQRAGGYEAVASQQVAGGHEVVKLRSVLEVRRGQLSLAMISLRRGS